MSLHMRNNVILPPRLEKLKFSQFENLPNTVATPSTPSSPAPEPFHIRILEPSEKEAVIEHLRKAFFRDEPLNEDMKMYEAENTTDMENYCVKTIGERNSLVAITDSGKIVGVCLNGVIRKKDNHEEYHITDPKFGKIFNLLKTMEEKSDTFGRFPDADEYFSLNILSVDGTWRGRGVAKQLVEKTIEIARELGMKLIRVDCSSEFSARAMAKLGFQKICELKFEDYKPDGEVVFKPAHPHTATQSFVWKF